jgi:hypothetical protein
LPEINGIVMRGIFHVQNVFLGIIITTKYLRLMHHDYEVHRPFQTDDGRLRNYNTNLVEHPAFLFRKIAYPKYDKPSKIFRQRSQGIYQKKICGIFYVLKFCI